MSEEDSKEILENKESAPPKKKRRWLKVLAILFGLFCCLLIGVYFYISSASFVRGQVFTRVQAQLNQPISSEEISFSPFSSLELNGFTLGDDPFLKAKKVKVAYDLMSIVGGDIKVDELTIEDAELNVIVNRDGKLNILSKMVEKIEDKQKKNKEGKKKDKNKAKEKKQSSKLDIQNINFNNLKLHVFVDHSKEKKRFELNLTNFSFSIPSIRNGEELKYELETAVNCKAGENFELKNGLIKISGKTKLSQTLEPELLGLDIKITDLDAINEKVSLPLKALNILADIGINKSKINLKSFEVKNPDNQSGVSAKGLIEKNNVDLNLAISNLDSSILDLALVPLSGSNAVIRWQKALTEASANKVAGFGDTVVNFNGTVKGNPNANIEAQGDLEIASLPMVEIARQSKLVPITTKLSYLIKTNNKTKILEVKKLNIDIKDDKTQLAGVNLSSPLKLDMKNNVLSSDKNDEVTFFLKRFNLNLIKAFIDEDKRGQFERGFISTNLVLVSKNSGKELVLDLKNLSLNELAVKKDNELISDINIQTSSKLSLSDLSKVNLNDMNLSVKQGNNQLTSLKASGLINLDDIEANITLSALKVHHHVKKFVPQKTLTELGLDNINLSSDSLKVLYTKGGVNAEGNLFIKDLALGGTTLPSPVTISKSTSFKISYDETKTLTVDDLELNLISNGQKALSAKLTAKQNEKLKLLSVQFSDLRVQPGLDKFIPADLKKKFGLSNINLDSKDLKVDMVKDQVSIKGSLFSNGLMLGGEQFKKQFKLSHSTSLDVNLVKDQLVELKSLKLNLQTDNNEALVLDTNATYRPGDKAIQLKVSQLAVSPGLRQLLPAELQTQYGLHNLNAKSKGIEINYTEGKAGFVKANLEVKDLGIAGTAYKPFTLSQGLDVDLAIDKSGLLKVGKLLSKTKPSFSQEIEIQAKGQVDLNFNRDDSEIIIDIPSTIDVDSLMKLAKEQEKKESSEAVTPEAVEQTAELPKEKTTPSSQPKVPKAPKKNPVKITVKASVNEVLFDKQSIKNIRTTAFINDQTYTLKEAVLQIGEGILKAAGRMDNGPTKSLSVNVSSSGPINLSPINDIINKGTDKKLSGNITIQQFSATTSGKNNDEMTKNLNAIGKLLVQDLKLRNYAQVAGGQVFGFVLGIDPAKLDFDTGIVDLKAENGIITLNKVSLEGQSLSINPRGTINLVNNTYDIKSKTKLGLAGGKLLKTLLSQPALRQLARSKSNEFESFVQDFPYDETKKMFIMKDDYIFNKILDFSKNEGSQSTLQQYAGLNKVSQDFLTDLLTHIGVKANFKETAAIVKGLSGEGNVGDSILNIGRGLLERELNRDRDKDKDKEDMKDEEKSDPIRGLLDGILGGGSKKKKEEKKKEQPKKEEKKKEEPINKKDDLIKKIDNLFK